MNKTRRYEYWFYILVLTVFISCRKDLYYEHFKEVDLHLEITYSLDWHLPCDENWNEKWPAEWTVDWDRMLPRVPEGVRLHVFDYGDKTPISSHNFEHHGGRVAINSGRYDMLLYNNDTEGIIFENMHAVNEAVATTRTRTRSASYSNKYPDELTANVPDMLFAAFLSEQELVKNEDEAKESPVNVYVERVLAKVRLYTDWKDMTLKNDVTYGDNDKKYTAVKLKKSKDGSEFIQVDGKDVYVIFTGWEVTSTASQSYLFKKVNSAWAFTPVWSWNHPEYHRSYWAMNPDGLTFDYLPYDQIAGKVGTQGASDNSSKSYNGTNLYCQENAADKYETGKKSSYNPATEVSNRTQAIIAAVLVTIDDSNVAHPIDLAKWGGTDYTKDNAMTAMLSVVQDQIYTKTIEGAGTADAKEIYTPITKDKVELVSGIKSGNADNESENSGRYLSYLQLKKGVTDTFYKADHTAYANLDDVNDVLANMPGARVWSSGQAYYYTDIKHLNDFLGVDDTDGKYGIVRNHIYDIAINSVSGLGTPVLDPEEVIVPQKPTNDETYLGARINILSWRVVKQNIDLEW